MRSPWWLKILAKLIIARLPLTYRFAVRFGIGRHGRMDQQDYARGVWERHYTRTSFGNKNGKFTCLELGPGDSLFSALFAHSAGAHHTYLVDTDDFANLDIESYKSVARAHLVDASTLKAVLACESSDAINTVLGSQYLTEGLASLRALPDQSIDFIWSHTVLQHVRVHDFAATLVECRRLLRSDGACSHRIDLTDHMGGELNNMRIATDRWEQPFMAESGFYTNRLRFSEIMALCAESGFDVEVLKTDRWDTPPLARSKLAEEFHTLSDDDLCVSAMDIILTPKLHTPKEGPA